MVLGDVAHSPVQAHETHWNCGFDVTLRRPTRPGTQSWTGWREKGLLLQRGTFPSQDSAGLFARSHAATSKHCRRADVRRGFVGVARFLERIDSFIYEG